MIKITDYAKRRKKLLEKIDEDALVILPSASESLRNGNDAFYPFRQNSDFYYLSGFQEPDSVLILAPKRKAGEYILFNRTRDKDKEKWDGPRAGEEGAKNTFLADQSFPIEQFKDKLPEFLEGRKVIYYPLGQKAWLDQLVLNSISQVRAKIRSGFELPLELKDISPFIHEMRLLKTKAEIEVMQKAVDITAKAHVSAMRACRPGMFEYELEAILMYEFYRHGARASAYNTIVGAGKNTCVLHYINNNERISDGDLVLIDAGAEYENYASDITRTFPANGHFTKEQKIIYELVLKAQMAAIAMMKPGVLFTKMQEVIIHTITEGLVKLGFLKGKVESLVEKEAYLPFYMHRSGHWLGLDVHDVGAYRIKEDWRQLEAGMVVTVEPGLYLAKDLPHLEKKWHNIGVRIEDDVLVTENGAEVLSAAIPKTVSDIETLMANAHATV